VLSSFTGLAIAKPRRCIWYFELLCLPCALPSASLTQPSSVLSVFFLTSATYSTQVVRSKLALDMYWSEKAIQRIEANFTKVPRAPAFKSDVMTFMQEDCNFSMEHADGSFMDHLRFCWEYCHANYKDKSPVPLLLHSIMGVGTNFFPMGKDKIPKLKQLVSEEDFGHIECFPSVLRLLIHQDLLNELLKKGDKIKNLRSISFFRVIDNGELTMDAEVSLLGLDLNDSFRSLFRRFFLVLDLC